jgi:DNA-binding CsgD family transcriptional regulator
VSPDIQHGLVQFRKSALPYDKGLRCRRGVFGTIYWLVENPEQVNELFPWDAEIRYSIRKWGSDFVDYAYAHAESPTKGVGVLDDLAQDLRLELLEHESRGDDVPRFSDKGALHPNVVQVCKNFIMDEWAKITIESPAKERLPFTSIHRIRNWEQRENSDGEIPEYLRNDGVGSLDDPIAGENDGGAGWDENAEGNSAGQRAIEGPQDEATGVDSIADGVITRRNANEDTMVDLLQEGANEVLLERAMPVLSDRERYAVDGWFGRHNSKITRKEVARKLGIKQSSVKKIVQRAMKKVVSEMARQQDTEQRSYGWAATLPTSFSEVRHAAQLKVWGDLHITRESYLAQLELREKYRKLAIARPDLAWMRMDGVDETGAWLEPRLTEFHDTYVLRWKTVGHFTVPIAAPDEDDLEPIGKNTISKRDLFWTVEQRETQEALEEARERAQRGGIAYTLESTWEKDVKLIGGFPTWHFCGNPECPYDVILVGRRQRIFLGGRGKVRGVYVPCPLCSLFAARELAKTCPLCITQTKLNTLCEGCFQDALPAEMERRRGKRVQAMPSNNGRPCWFVDLRTDQDAEIGLAHLEDHEAANGRVIIATDPIALPAIVLEEPVEVLVPAAGNGAAHVYAEKREAPAHLAGMTPEEYLERQKIIRRQRR